jgi:hypothetical protein
VVDAGPVVKSNSSTNGTLLLAPRY